MKTLDKEQIKFVSSILKIKDEEHKLELIRQNLKGTGYILLQDHPRYGEAISIINKTK